MKIDTDAIKKLADLLNDTGLTEIEVGEGDSIIRVSKGGTVVAAAGPAPAQHNNMGADPATPRVANTDQPSESVAASHPGAVTSPMVGTIYMAAEPGAADFVKKGDSVSEGDTLLIIEAMKVMNPIKAPKSGTISQILVQNEQPIEFGDVLMVIE